MRLRRRRRSSQDQPDKVLVTTIRTADPSRPTTCSHDCDGLASKWVRYLWRALERDAFVAGQTDEEVCENHFQQLLNDEDVHMEEWGTL